MFNSQQIIDDIVDLTLGQRIWVAYSGGVDSHVLLHLLAMGNHPGLATISAIHIDHQLHTDSTQWAQHCADISADLNVEFCHIKVDVTDIDELGLEAAARKARYQAFQQQLNHNDVLLTAQHQQDQAETLLLQLFRGAGPKGLSAMPRQFALAETKVIRPLLNVSQQDILLYAQQHQLRWIDDPSNIETRWNRNYIRHNIWPVIVERWPSAAKTLSRSAAHCADASELLDDLAAQDRADLAVDNSSDYLPISSLLLLSSARRKNVLRHYIERKQFALPSTACLTQVINEVCLAKQDSMPIVCWQGVEVRRYQDQLYFMRPLSQHNVNEVVQCRGLAAVTMGGGDVLSWQETSGKGLRKQTLIKGYTLCFRQGGERIKLAGSSHHKSLKNLFQQWQIPPWQRDRIPLLYSGTELIAVVGYAFAEGYTVSNDQQGYVPIV